MSFLQKRRQFLSAAAIFALMAALPGASHAATPAEKYVQRIGNRVLAAARAGSTSQFHALLKANADIPRIAIFSLGPYRRKLPASRRSEYYRLVARHISKVFNNHSPQLRGQSLIATSSRDRGSSVIVTSRVKYASGKTSKVLWRLVKKGGGFRVFDVNVQGIWLANTQKTDFVSILKRNRGDFNALMNYLKK